MRIVSLLPSATEIVYALGLGDELVGVTHECDWPPEVAGKPVECVRAGWLGPTRSDGSCTNAPDGECGSSVGLVARFSELDASWRAATVGSTEHGIPFPREATSKSDELLQDLFERLFVRGRYAHREGGGLVVCPPDVEMQNVERRATDALGLLH